MFYLVLGFCTVWVCHFAYLAVLDRQATQLRRRLEARANATPDRT
ncbi:MAG: CcmD family protein [Planctomycetes bacterium]|nr:CcmD family protein [Planctomycetota bacterium]